MKKYVLLLVAVSLLSLSSCEKKSFNSFGFNSDIEKNSTGLNVFYVSRYVESIYLVGTINCSEGAVVVELLDPHDVAIYYDTIQANDTVIINNYYNSKIGYWKLKYESLEANGEIDLHVVF